jgi:zinc protease
MVFAIYNPMNVDKVLAGVREEVDRLLSGGVTVAELDRARSGLLQQQQIQRSNDRALAALLAEDLYVGRTMQFEADFERKIRELTPDAVNAALRKYVDAGRMTVVTAGDFKKKK